jgi:hypothetical protein
VCLGLLLAAAVNPVMKYSAEPWWSSSNSADLPPADWFGEAPPTPHVADGFRPSFDYDEVFGAEWALPENELAIGPEPMPQLEEAFEVADEAAEAAGAVEEAAAEDVPLGAEANSSARKSQLLQGGLY